MLKQITFTEAEKLINSKVVFAHAIITKNWVDFTIINEPDYDGGAVNFSDRGGEITPELMNEKLFDIFYHEDFQMDGGLEYYKNYSSIMELLQTTSYIPPTEDNYFYLTDGNMEEIMQLTDGTIAWFIRAEGE